MIKIKVPFFVPWISKSDKKAVLGSLNQRWLTNGPILKKFEVKFQKYISTEHAIGVGSCTNALHLSLRAIRIKKNDEVIVPTFTFAAPANAVIYCGAKPIFADIDEYTFNISPEEIRRKATKRTKAVIVVHYAGQSCEMEEILNVCKEKKLKLIEDCAHALGAKYQNKKCGTFGITGCFSFYPTKMITSGEGGMVSTNSSNIDKKIRLLRSHSMSVRSELRERRGNWRYDITDLGYNYRMDEIRAALGLSQFNQINNFNKKRVEIAKKYDKALGKIKGIRIPLHRSDRNHIYHLYTIKITKDYPYSRDELFDLLFKKGIGTSVQYYPLHLMSYYRRFNIRKNEFIVANKIKDQVISLPIFPRMAEKQINFVISKLV